MRVKPVPRAQSRALFDALASAGKTLHANPGRHGEIPASELDSTLRFYARTSADTAAGRPRQPIGICS
jgi:hypothetical protein